MKPSDCEKWLEGFGCTLESYWHTNGLIRRLLRSDGQLAGGGKGQRHALHVIYAQVDPEPPAKTGKKASKNSK